MPSYDVECSGCGYCGIENVKLADLDSWDLSAACPNCCAVKSAFRRVIKHAPALHGNGQSVSAQLASKKDQFIRSGGRDSMRHDAAKRSNPEQMAAARESVKRGEFEGF